MGVTASQILGGTPVVYTAAVGEALTELDNLAPPAVTITPGGSWVALGGTVDDYELAYESEFGEVKVNEHLGPVKHFIESEGLIFKLKMAETDFTHLVHGMPMTAVVTTVAAAGDQTAQDQLGIGDGTQRQRALLILGTSPEGGSRVLHIPKAEITGGMALTFSKAEASAFDLEWTALCDPTLGAGNRMASFYDITAVATS